MVRYIVDLKKQRKLRWLHFLGGLKEIKAIFNYKENNSINHLFNLPCKVEREVQDRQRTKGPLGVVGQIKGKQGLPQPPPVTLYFNNRAQFIASTTSTRAREASMSQASFSLVNSIGRS